MPEHVLVFSAGYEPDFSRILEQIVRDELQLGHRVSVCDLGSLMLSPTISYAPKVLALGGLEHPGERFAEHVTRLGAEYIRAAELSDSVADIPADARQALSDAAQSAMYTYFRTDQLNLRSRRVRRVHDRLVHEGERSYRAVTAVLRAQGFTRAYLPNGRFPAQRMAKAAATDAGVPVFHYERGTTRDHAYLRPYSPHDRVAGQQDILDITANRTPAELDAIADDWLAARQPSSSSTNEYSAIWAAAQAPQRDAASSSAPIIGFFTSSQDEFLHLGPDWQLHRWESQFAAFDTLMTAFETAGFRCVLRVHPNLSTKDHACFLREISGLQRLQQLHPDLEVYWHDDPTSSYALLDECSGVVVWDSTIGLEASARGIPVWNCAASYYGLVADTRQVLGGEDVTDTALTPWNVDPHGAKRFIAGMVLRDYPLNTSSQDWATWNLSSPPLTARVAALAVSGGAPTVTDSVKSIVEPWRHRRAAINLRLLRAKLARSS